MAVVFLKQNTVAQNVADKYNAKVNNADVQRMVAYVNQNTAAIREDSFTVPLTWQGFPFLGGAAKLIVPLRSVAFPQVNHLQFIIGMAQTLQIALHL